MRLLVMPWSAARSMDELKNKTVAHTHAQCHASPQSHCADLSNRVIQFAPIPLPLLLCTPHGTHQQNFKVQFCPIELLCFPGWQQLVPCRKPLRKAAKKAKAAKQMKAVAEALKQLLACWLGMFALCHRLQGYVRSYVIQVKSLHIATPERAAMHSFAKQLSGLEQRLSWYDAGVVMANALGRARARWRIILRHRSWFLPSHLPESEHCRHVQMCNLCSSVFFWRQWPWVVQQRRPCKLLKRREVWHAMVSDPHSGWTCFGKKCRRWASHTGHLPMCLI